MKEDIGTIPEEWRNRVSTILRQGKVGTVLIRQRARRDWASLPFCPFDCELADAIAAALEDEHLVGKRHQMDEPGETYAFIFPHRNVSIYAKVNLTTPDEIVIVYSAHRPLKGDELL
jgi:hypothetical protein